MKVEFGKKYLRELYETGKSSDKKYRFQPQVVNGYVKCVRALNKAKRMEDLFMIKSLNYEKLKGAKKDLSAVHINNRYRLEFREIFNPNNSLIIEICLLTDISNHYN